MSIYHIPAAPAVGGAAAAAASGRGQRPAPPATRRGCVAPARARASRGPPPGVFHEFLGCVCEISIEGSGVKVSVHCTHTHSTKKPHNNVVKSSRVESNAPRRSRSGRRSRGSGRRFYRSVRRHRWPGLSPSPSRGPRAGSRRARERRGRRRGCCVSDWLVETNGNVVWKGVSESESFMRRPAGLPKAPPVSLTCPPPPRPGAGWPCASRAGRGPGTPTRSARASAPHGPAVG